MTISPKTVAIWLPPSCHHRLPPQKALEDKKSSGTFWLTIKGRTTGTGHGVGAVRIGADLLTDIADGGGPVKPGVLRRNIGLLHLMTNPTTLAVTESGIPWGANQSRDKQTFLKARGGDF